MATTDPAAEIHAAGTTPAGQPPAAPLVVRRTAAPAPPSPMRTGLRVAALAGWHTLRYGVASAVCMAAVIVPPVAAVLVASAGLALSYGLAFLVGLSMLELEEGVLTLIAVGVMTAILVFAFVLAIALLILGIVWVGIAFVLALILPASLLAEWAATRPGWRGGRALAARVACFLAVGLALGLALAALPFGLLAANALGLVKGTLDPWAVLGVALLLMIAAAGTVQLFGVTLAALEGLRAGGTALWRRAVTDRGERGPGAALYGSRVRSPSA